MGSTSVFDVAHYRIQQAKGKPDKVIHYLSDAEARRLLNACRTKMPFPITKLGHTAALGLHTHEFADDGCFHFEVKHPVRA